MFEGINPENCQKMEIALTNCLVNTFHIKKQTIKTNRNRFLMVWLPLGGVVSFFATLSPN